MPNFKIQTIQTSMWKTLHTY